MTSAPLAVVELRVPDLGRPISSRATFWRCSGPSFFTGHLIARFGSAHRHAGAGDSGRCRGRRPVRGGTTFYVTMILLGLGWNFGYIGATAMLTRAYRPEEPDRAGLNDAVVFAGVFLASLSSGGLMNWLDCRQAGWSTVNLAMLPFLVPGGGALIVDAAPADVAQWRRPCVAGCIQEAFAPGPPGYFCESSSEEGPCWSFSGFGFLRWVSGGVSGAPGCGRRGTRPRNAASGRHRRRRVIAGGVDVRSRV